MLKVLALTLLITTAFCKPCSAELYKFTDEKGNFHITDNPGAVPEALRPRATETHDRERPRGKTGDASGSAPGSDPGRPAEAGEKSGPAATLNAGALQNLSEKDEAGPDAEGRKDAAPPGHGDLAKLPPEYREQFKDVREASSIPPEGATASCAELKAGVNKDVDRIMQAIRELAAEKKKGELGFLAKAKGIWALKSVGWVVFRIMNSEEQCVKEFEKENERRFEAMAREIEALTEEVGEKESKP